MRLPPYLMILQHTHRHIFSCLTRSYFQCFYIWITDFSVFLSFLWGQQANRSGNAHTKDRWQNERPGACNLLLLQLTRISYASIADWRKKQKKFVAFLWRPLQQKIEKWMWKRKKKGGMFQFPVLVITVFSRNSQLYNPVAPIQMFAFSTLLLLLIYFSHFSSFFFYAFFFFVRHVSLAINVHCSDTFRSKKNKTIGHILIRSFSSSVLKTNTLELLMAAWFFCVLLIQPSLQHTHTFYLRYCQKLWSMFWECFVIATLSNGLRMLAVELFRFSCISRFAMCGTARRCRTSSDIK